MSIEHLTVSNGDIDLHVAVEGDGPVVLCVHGWPELWYSWRHQISALSASGYRVAAMDVRGYGASSKPHPIAAYSMRNLAADVAAVARALSDEPVVLVGHDWGAPIVWNTSLLHEDLIGAVAGLSVPYIPASAAPAFSLHDIYAGRFFYQTYFQTEGVAEAELEADVRLSLRKIYYALGGETELDTWIAEKPADANLLDSLTNPEPFPAWLTEADLDVYTEAFLGSGFRGPLNRYRAQAADRDDVGKELTGRKVAQPACFIAGARDAVRHFVPGGDLYAQPEVGCDDLRSSTIIEGAGHWVQQEAPAATNEALLTFLRSL